MACPVNNVAQLASEQPSFELVFHPPDRLVEKSVRSAAREFWRWGLTDFVRLFNLVSATDDPVAVGYQ